ncbi:hypothetical protein CFE70_009414 [Pyrenophora teres f. teres 0-1]
MSKKAPYATKLERNAETPALLKLQRHHCFHALDPGSLAMSHFAQSPGSNVAPNSLYLHELGEALSFSRPTSAEER